MPTSQGISAGSPAPPRTGADALRGRIPAIDGLRVLAVLAVFGQHSGLSLFRNGGVGVDVFFVISGFVITRLLVREHDATGRIRLWPFYVARWRRLMPAASVACLIVLIVSLTVGGQWSGEWKYALLGLTYTTDFAEASGHISKLLVHFWSLAVEEQFYLIWPFALTGLLAWSTKRRRPLLPVVIVLAVCVLPLVERILLWHAGLSLRSYYSPEARADQLLAGCAFALFLRYVGSNDLPGWLVNGTRRLVWPAAVGLALAAARWTAHPGTSGRLAESYLTVGMTLTAAAAAIVIASFVVSPQAPLSRLIGWGPLAWVGRQWTYGFYLFHWPIIVMCNRLDPPAHTAVAFVLSVLAAAASWWFVERRFRRGHHEVPAAAGTSADASPTAGRHARTAG